MSFTEEEKKKALQLYDEAGSIAKVIYKFGYPTRHNMHTWTKNRNIEKKPKQYSFTDSPENSACEEFFGKMKNKMFYGRNFVGVTIETFVEIINDYIVWYNTKRIKASLGYMSPMEYRQSLGLN